MSLFGQLNLWSHQVIDLNDENSCNAGFLYQAYMITVTGRGPDIAWPFEQPYQQSARQSAFQYNYQSCR
jgi:hypothetical protein